MKDSDTLIDIIRQGSTRTDSSAHSGTISRVRVDSDSVYSIDNRGNLAIWSKRTLDLLHLLTIPEVPFHSLGVDDKYIYVGSTYLNSVIRVWSKKDLSLITTLDDKSGSILDLCISDETLYSCCSNGLLHSWFINDLSNAGSVATGQSILQAVAVDKEYVYAGGIDDRIDVFLRQDLTRVTELVGHDADIFSLLADGNFVYSGSGEVWWGGPGSPRPSIFETSIRVWEKESWMCTDTLEGHSDNINALSRRDDLIYSVSDDGTLRVTSASSRATILVLDLDMGAITDLAIDDAAVFIACHDNSVWKIPHRVLEKITR